jgi:hypothetical protein
VLDYGFAQRDLSVSGHDHLVVATDAEYGGGADAAARAGFGVFEGCYWSILLHERNFQL